MTLPTTGQSASRSTTITAAMVSEFCHLTGDLNPIHLDEAFAKASRFGKLIVPGMFTASLIPAVIAGDLPGPGSIYLGQTIKFTAPVYVGETVTVAVTVTDVNPSRGFVTLSTICSVEDRKVLEGEARIMVECRS